MNQTDRVKKRITLPFGAKHDSAKWRPPTLSPKNREMTPFSKSTTPGLFTQPIVLDGKYNLMNEVGRGAMGIVFLAEDVTLKRKVAVKFLMPHLASSEEFSNRFHNEAVAMASIQNHNVAQIFAFGEYSSIPYFVMEYLDGMTVEYLIDTHNRRGSYISVSEGLEILIQSLSGLAAIHKSEAVHRDIKPGNIMLTQNPVRVVITDFGMVRLVQMTNDIRPLAGTPAYMAPEIAQGIEGASESLLTDIYSMGVAAYELFTGEIPFTGDSWTEILQKHINEMPLLPSSRRKRFPEELDDIIWKAMAKQPQDRYQNCDSFLSDLFEVQKLWFSNEPRRFQPFRSDLPSKNAVVVQKRSSETPRKKPLVAPAAPARAIHVVVADADSQFRALVHGTLKIVMPDCQIHSAPNGAIALDLVEKYEPHLLVMSLALPEVSSFEVVAILRGDAKYDATEIVIAKDNGAIKGTSIFRSLGVTDVIDKPTASDALAAVFRPILEKAQES